MDFLDLVHKKEKKISKPATFVWLACLLLLILVLLAMKFWPQPEKQPFLNYLPAETNFYMHFADSNTWDSGLLSEYPIDLTFSQQKIDKVEDLLGVNFLNAKEIVWFRTDLSVGDDYLIKISPLQKQAIEELQAKNIDVYFFQLDKDVLLITDCNKVVDSSVLAKGSDLRTVDNDQGISLYWQFDKAPEFLGQYKPFLTSLFSSKEAKVHIYQTKEGARVLNFYDVDSSLDQESFLPYKMPKDFDFGMAFSKYTSVDIASSLADNLIQPFLTSLPYNVLSKNSITDDILNDAAIFTKGDSWLLIFFKDADPVLLNFLDSFEVGEVARTLPDGTLYQELVVAPEQSRQEVAFQNKIYYNLVDLYLFAEQDINYLSNSQEMIEQIVAQDNQYSLIWGNCLKTGTKVGDFLAINTQNIEESQLKDYLLGYNIQELAIFSYLSGSTEGLQICF